MLGKVTVMTSRRGTARALDIARTSGCTVPLQFH